MVSIALEIESLRALRAIKAALLELKWLRAATLFEIAARRHGLALKYGYNPAQPRVPKGEDGAGEWTDTGAGAQVRVAGGGRSSGGGRGRFGSGDFPGATHGQLVRLDQSIARTNEALQQISRYNSNWQSNNDKALTAPGSHRRSNSGIPRRGRTRRRRDLSSFAVELAAISAHRSVTGSPAASSSQAFDGQAWISSYRAAQNMPDLFGQPTWPNDKGTVAVTEIDGRLYFGTNSTAPGYMNADENAARSARNEMIKRYPSIMETDNIGEVPKQLFVSRRGDGSFEICERQWWEFGG